MFSSSCPLRRVSPFVETFFAPRSLDDPQSTDPLEETIQDILARAKAYNIQSVNQLEFESHVLTKQYSGRLLVDRQPYKEDFYLWTILLDFQKLKNGTHGTKLIWKGLKFFCGNVDLPFVGYQGDRLWSAFVAAGARHHKFLEEIIRYETRKGCQRPRFFSEVVGALLKSSNPSPAKYFARMLQVAHRPTREELYDLFMLASSAERPESLQIFREVYAAMPSAGLYGKMVAYLCSQERFSDAWTMHRYLLSVDDLPQSFEEIQPLVLDLVNSHMRLESFLHELGLAGVSMEAQARTFYSQERSLRLGFASENLNIVSSNTFGVRPQTLSDAFAARAFMTTTFSFDAVLAGLRLFGLKTIGPASIRAIGLTAANSQELRDRLTKLSDNEVDTGSSRFSRLVKELVQRGEEEKLQAVLISDQHADVFEDLGLQRRLLLKHYHDEDWVSVERTLFILSLGSVTHSAKQYAANQLLQAALKASKWSHVQTIMDKMTRADHRLSETSVAISFRAALSKREASCPPAISAEFDDLGFLISIWLQVLESGFKFPVARWREPIRRLGMSGRLDELETLLVQLLHFYGTGDGVQRIENAHDGVADVERLLSPRLQSAIIDWGFIHMKPASKFNPTFGWLNIHPWRRGVMFLRRLKDRHYINIDERVVRRTCLLRLRQLFHLRTQSILHRNRRAHAKNRYLLQHYAQELDKAWTEPLFRDKAWLYRAVTVGSLQSRQQRRVATWKELEHHRSHHRYMAERGGQDDMQPQDSIPGDVVIPGGPLSQSYWSSGQNIRGVYVDDTER